MWHDLCATPPKVQREYDRTSLVAQMRYDAYGQVIAADHLRPHPFIGVGHKGLFFDRFDRGVSDSQAQGAVLPPPGSASGTLVETPLVVPFARGIYHNRNRTYMPGGGSPQVIAQAGITGPNSQGEWTLSQSGLASGAAAHGRFMQADPNQAGTPTQASMVFHGIGIGAGSRGFDMRGRFGDGENLYQYLRSAALIGADPSGLEFSYGNLSAAMGVQGLLGGLIGGTMNSMSGGNFWVGAGAGFVGGAVGGAAFYTYSSAFAASGAGLFASTIRGMGAAASSGMSQGGIQAGLETYAYTGNSRLALAEARWGAALGMATAIPVGGAGGAYSSWVRQADDVVLAAAGGATTTNIQFGANANQVFHTFRHTDALGLNREVVRSAVTQDLMSKTSQVISGKPFNQVVTIAGQRVQYTAYRLPGDVLNVGRIHGVP